MLSCAVASMHTNLHVDREGGFAPILTGATTVHMCSNEVSYPPLQGDETRLVIMEFTTKSTFRWFGDIILRLD